MAVIKIEMRPKGNGSYADILYPKTSSDMVVMPDGDALNTFIGGTKTDINSFMPTYDIVSSLRWLYDRDNFNYNDAVALTMMGVY